MTNFDEIHLSLLQNIEFSIVQVYRAERSLLDVDAKAAVDALVRYYHAEEEGRTPPSIKLGELGQRVFLSVQRMCEWRLGRGPFPGDESEKAESKIPLSELVKSLREIQKSIPRWTQRNGRQGYLDFVSPYVP